MRKGVKKTKPAKKAKQAKKAAAKPKAERSNKKAEVIAMMKRAKGAMLPEIMKATGWRPHTVRGFVSHRGLNIVGLIKDTMSAHIQPALGGILLSPLTKQRSSMKATSRGEKCH